MRSASVVVATAVILAALTPRAAGQQVLLQPQVADWLGGGEVLLAPVDAPLVGMDGFPLNTRAALDSPTAPPVTGSGVRGLTGGIPVGNRVTANVGFTYLIPLWSFRGFQLAAPKGFESFFPVFGATGPVDSHFAYAPRISLDYYIKDLDFGVSTSGTFINLSGRVDRQQASTDGGSGQLTANATVTIVSANLVEFNRLFAFTELFSRKEPGHENVADSVVDLRIGTRYVAVEQNYTGSLIGGVGQTNVTNRFSTQTFRGIGLTTAGTWTMPVGENWASFLSVRGSLIVGENRRNSTVTATVTGLPGFSATQFESRTQLVPVTEIECGCDWGWDLANRLRDRLGPSRFTIRVAAVGQYWGGLGPFSAGTNQGFRTTDLFLVGGYVQAGYHY